MGSKTVVYRQKVEDNLSESFKHLKRLNDAFSQLQLHYDIPLNKQSYRKILTDLPSLAYSDQIIYRFSKAQDTTGAKFFKTFLLYQGENVDKPFLDILDRFEKMEMVNIDEWFFLREIRNEITHEYEDNEELAKNILNAIYKHKNQLKKIINTVKIG